MMTAIANLPVSPLVRSNGCLAPLPLDKHIGTFASGDIVKTMEETVVLLASIILRPHHLKLARHRGIYKDESK